MSKTGFHLAAILLMMLSGCLKPPALKTAKPVRSVAPALPEFDANASATEAARVFQNCGARLIRNAAGDVRYVVMTDLPVADQALASLAELEHVEVIGLSGTHVTDEGMRHLRQLPRLTYLFLNDTQVGDEGLKSLADNVALRYISMDNTNVSMAAVEAFRRESPGTVVQYTPRGFETLVSNIAARSPHGKLDIDSLTGARGRSSNENEQNALVLRYRQRAEAKPPGRAESGR